MMYILMGIPHQFVPNVLNPLKEEQKAVNLLHILICM